MIKLLDRFIKTKWYEKILLIIGLFTFIIVMGFTIWILFLPVLILSITGFLVFCVERFTNFIFR